MHVPTASVASAPSLEAEYEFNAEQNRIFQSLARQMRFVGIFVALLGFLASGFAALALLTTLGNTLSTALQAQQVSSLLVNLVIGFIGVYTVRAAGGFRRVVDTAGNDISHLMGALTNLKGVYRLQLTFAVIGTVLFLGAALVALLSLAR